MTEVRRYSLHTDTTPNGEGYASMVGVIDGDYVAYSDHEAVVRENERLRDALRNLLVMLPSDNHDYGDKERIPQGFCYVRWQDIREGHAALSASGASR